MPRTQREYIKRYLKEAHNDLDRFMGNCVRIKDMYAPVHPGHAEFLEALAVQALELQKVLDEFDNTIA